MSDEHEQPEKVWDEYDWERFLQQQDQKAERYLELLERYNDHPERDAIVAKEMGWDGTEDAEARAWMEEVEIEFSQGDEEEEHADEEEVEGEEFLEVHPLYRLCVELTLWTDDLFEEEGDDFAVNPLAGELSEQICYMSGKVAAAVCDAEESELGMTIAYLKRALRAANRVLGAISELQEQRAFSQVRSRQLRTRLFQIRDGIVELMGTSRAEWRRRHDS
ncbi:MAG: hypothetical protein RLZZ399_183 [Verrucomicrobiota bacterium]|jgi:hypothetical protein